MKNPCIDTTYVRIKTTTLVSQSYDLFDFDPIGLQWDHSPFTLDTLPFTHQLCGPFTYVARFQGAIINSASTPMSYELNSRGFTFYSEDFNLIGDHEFSIEAYLTEHPDMKTLQRAVTATIAVGDPCPDPASVVAPP